MSRNLSINLYLTPFIVIFMKNSIRTVCVYSNPFPVFKSYKLDLQIMPLISVHLRFTGSVDIVGF